MIKKRTALLSRLSHNPPQDGGIKYNPTHGGPAEAELTRYLEDRANVIIAEQMQGVKRTPIAYRLSSSS